MEKLLTTGNIAITVLAICLSAAIRAIIVLWRENRRLHESRVNDMKAANNEIQNIHAETLDVMRANTQVGKDLATAVRIADETRRSQQ